MLAGPGPLELKPTPNSIEFMELRAVADNLVAFSKYINSFSHLELWEDRRQYGSGAYNKLYGHEIIGIDAGVSTALPDPNYDRGIDQIRLSSLSNQRLRRPSLQT